MGTGGYFSQETIMALATPTGGALCIVRVSGSQALSVLEKLTSESFIKKLTPFRMTRARLFHAGRPLDDALVAYFPEKKSFTGEDTVEYFLHGGRFLVDCFLESLLSLGIRLALPGEFSFRSVFHQKMTLFQAQGIPDLLEASNEQALKIALNKVSGESSSLLEALGKRIQEVVVAAELGIDFSDQEIPELSLSHLKKKILDVSSLLNEIQETYDKGKRIHEGLSLAFLGLPNAGKSSFFNFLLKQERALVSPWAGTTRDTLREKFSLKVNNSHFTFQLMDTAGLRVTEDPLENMGIQRSFQAAQTADLIFFFFDPLQSFEEQEKSLQSLQELEKEEKKSILGIITKIDLFAQKNQPDFSRLSIPCIPTSCVTGEGKKEVCEWMAQEAKKFLPQEEKVFLTRKEHQQAIKKALHHLHHAQESEFLDFFASDLRLALQELSPLLGYVSSDMILEKIFSDFCIGK